MPDDRQDIMRRRLRELIEEWRPLEAALRTSDYPHYSIGFPHSSPEEVHQYYALAWLIRKEYGCSILIAEIAFLDLFDEFGPAALTLRPRH